MDDVPSNLRAWVDSPQDLRPPTRRVIVRGWCYARSGAPVVAVRARVGWRRYAGMHGLERADVAQAFAEPGAGDSGFEIAATLPSGAATCDLQARCEGGGWTTFATLPFFAPSESLADRLRRARFWWRAWRGRRSAWELVGPEEQAYLVSRTSCLGWLTIARFRQHAPRPLRVERFPGKGLAPARLPRFAIVTPSFNQAAYLEQAARSVLEQEGVRVDYLVMDGGSTDGSRAILERLASEFPPARPTRLAHWASEPDGGQADAIAKGFAIAEGGPDDVMAYLNSDDRLMPGALRFVGEYFARHPEIDVVYGHRVLIDDRDREIGRWLAPRRACDDLGHFDMVPQETLFWRRRIWERVGGIDVSLHFALDWDLLQRFEKAGARFARLPWFLGLFRCHESQKTRTRMEESGIPEMERLRERALGRRPSQEEFDSRMRHVRFDSALVNALLKLGLRV